MAKISGGAVIGWKVSSKCKIAKQISFFLNDVTKGPFFWNNGCVAQNDFSESVTANAFVSFYAIKIEKHSVKEQKVQSKWTEKIAIPQLNFRFRSPKTLS